LQVYTFVNTDASRPGIIAMRLDYTSRGSLPEGQTCGNGELSQIPYEVITRDRSGQIRREANVIPAAKCGERLSETARLLQGAVPDLRVR
jgi:hypothetical protein